jgi:alpha-tubulin suppressor-like RCC1 family protein
LRCIALTGGGCAHSWGDGIYGALGHGAGVVDVAEPRCVEALEGHTFITSVSASAFHSLYLTEGGRALSCGKGSTGRLGHGGDVTVFGLPYLEWQDEWVPRVIESLTGQRVTYVCAGGSHSVFITEAGGALVCGGNFSGQCGLGAGAADIVTVPTAVVEQDAELFNLVTAEFKAKEDVVYKRVVAGNYSTLLLDSAGAAWVCGGEEELGAFEAEVGDNVHTPTLLPGLAGHSAVVGAALSLGGLRGDETALLLCSDGKVLGCLPKAWHGTVRGRLPGAHLPEDDNEAVALTVLPPLHR